MVPGKVGSNFQKLDLLAVVLAIYWLLMRDLIEYIVKPHLWFNSIDLAGCKKGIHHCGVLCSFVTSGKEVVLSSQSQRSDGIFD